MISGYTETFGAMIVMAGSLLSNNPLYTIDINDINVKETFCLAQNIWFEARNSSEEDRTMVGLTTLNRVRDSRYGETICGVVRQGVKNNDGSMKRNACQFSWYCDGKPDLIEFENPVDVRIWNNIVEISILLQTGYIDDKSNGATHYHAHYVSPGWANKKIWLASTDGHKYYKSANYDVFMDIDEELVDDSFVKRIRKQLRENMINAMVAMEITPIIDTPPVAVIPENRRTY